MNAVVPNPAQFLSLLAYLAMLLFVIAFMLGASYLLGQRHKGRHTDDPYESGIKSTGMARMRFSVKFYVVAMLFVIFDLEAAFIFGWAVAAREVGWNGYWGLVMFVAILIAGLIYEWRVGAIDWVAGELRSARRRREAR